MSARAKAITPSASRGSSVPRAGFWPKTSCRTCAITLSDRVQRERLDNVAVKLGTADNPMLPAGSFDRIFLVHMYHEVASPMPSCGTCGKG